MAALWSRGDQLGGQTSYEEDLPESIHNRKTSGQCLILEGENVMSPIIVNI